MVPTRDHDSIRQWAERYGARPAEIRQGKHDGEPAILYFLFGKLALTGTPELHPISWESFFAQFDLLGLSMAFDERSPQFSIVRVEKSGDQLTAN